MNFSKKSIAGIAAVATVALYAVSRVWSGSDTDGDQTEPFDQGVPADD